MGWSCSSVAADTLAVIERACKATHNEPSQCAFVINNKRYFYETSRRDQQDGGIAGTIYLCLPNDMCRRAGTFRIDGTGNVVRGPVLFKRAAANCTKGVAQHEGRQKGATD